MEEIPKKQKIVSSDRNKPESFTLAEHVKQTIDLYFSQLNGHDAVNIYAMVINEVEKPLLESTLNHMNNNQSKAARSLGLSRSTLRKKLEFHRIS
jgi:Fis family transcriptional regulator